MTFPNRGILALFIDFIVVLRIPIYEWRIDAKSVSRVIRGDDLRHETEKVTGPQLETEKNSISEK